jgi:pyruvate/2-oxoglutarate dehydrogenase complex dihydrolipoamide acyltransferase (E2) component
MQIRLSEALWATSLLPEGGLERWRAGAGDIVAAGAPLAEVRIEQALHEVVAPCAGRLRIDLPENAVVEPGQVIGEIEPHPGEPS